MKENQQKYKVLLLFCFFLVSCNPDNSLEIAKSISEVKSNFISDSRLVYWDIQLEKEESSFVVNGSTTSEKAFEELLNITTINKINNTVELLPAEKFKQDKWAVVTLSVCNIRKEGKHSSELVTQALMGTPVKLYKEQNGWYLIQTPDDYFGWVDSSAISLKNGDNLAEWKTFKKVIYIRQFGFVYCESNINSGVCSDLVLADLLSVTGNTNNFFEVLLADGRKGFVRKEECASLEVWKKKEVVIENVLSAALNFNGTPYLWGGTSAKMVDCSGFTKTVYYANGIILQRDASQQTLYGAMVDVENNYNNLKAGDLVFFGKSATKTEPEKVTHVGLYIGNSEFIHASGKVRINSLNKNKTNYTDYYESAFVRARRIINNVNGEGMEWITENEFYKEILPE